MVGSLDKAWSNMRYGHAQRAPGKHYKLDINKLSDRFGSDLRNTDTSSIIDILEKDLAKSHEEAVTDSFARHVTFVYDSMKVGSDLYIKDMNKALSPWDAVREMYYIFNKDYNCYSFKGKVTLTKLNKDMDYTDLWPVYADFDNYHLAESFLALPYISVCPCEKNKLNKNCSIYCVHKHANIQSRYITTKLLFEDRSFKKMYTELYPTNPATVEMVLASIPSIPERATHLILLSRGLILERLSSEDFAKEIHSVDTLHRHAKLIEHIGVPSIGELNTNPVIRLKEFDNANTFLENITVMRGSK